MNIYTEFYFKRMIMAFEELRVQAENARLEMCFKCENSLYSVYTAGLTILYFIDLLHAVSGQKNKKC